MAQACRGTARPSCRAGGGTKGHRPVIDIVATRGGMLVFTEVKARRSVMQAGDAIDRRTMRRLMNAAQALCMLNSSWNYDEMRFDVVVVLPDGNVHRIEDAFRME
ncbi:YraN family protein [Novacetimonas pomaceti]|uniref:Endonuclease n=1 Tax=Novacetimonas pomaceti TaxID=2021998 RepID=A0ABX5P3J8_9PROT|nr:YraN family protein [Novacetimonas pomaceti]PYD48021.1 hypothetical protein C3920_06810 [Novacetimonas pomaceti]